MNAYLHIPFCASICHYCDFTSFAGLEGRMNPYVEVLCSEIGRSGLEGPLQTVYFGGGTPSLLQPVQLEKLIKALKAKSGFAPGAEISMEANPETVDLEKLKGYLSLGVNRLSFGAQASQREVLRKLGRGHDWERVEGAFGEARAAGFDNLNLDLMFGLSGQTFEMFQESVQKALALDPEHLSLYALQVEEGTPLARQVQEGLVLPDEDTVADEYAWAQSFLASQGFGQYEVSNFSRPGFSCRHNWNIWRGEDYWGFGVAAVGTVQGVRYSHGDNLGEYIQGMDQGLSLQREYIPEAVRTFEKLMLGLRTNEGVLKEEVDRYAISRGIAYEAKFQLFQKEGLLSLEKDRYHVTSKGYFLLNGLLETLVA